MTKMTRLNRPLTLALCLTAALFLASCGQTESPAAAPTTAPPETHGATTGAHAPTSPAPSSTRAASLANSASKRIDVTVKGKEVTPAPETVNIAVGQSLTVAVTSDHDDTLHAHGFEVEEDIKAGQRVEVTVKGAQTGVFEFELHHPELRLFQVAVR
jgi:hypothetical protein